MVDTPEDVLEWCVAELNTALARYHTEVGQHVWLQVMDGEEEVTVLYMPLCVGVVTDPGEEA